MTVRVEQSDYFRRDGNDVHTDADISLSQAILGGVIRIQGLYEDLNIRIQPGTFFSVEIWSQSIFFIVELLVNFLRSLELFF